MDSAARPKGGWTLTIASAAGTCHKLHTYDNPSGLVAENLIYNVRYEERHTPDGRVAYNILKGRPTLLIDRNLGTGRSVGQDQDFNDHLRGWLMAHGMRREVETGSAIIPMLDARTRYLTNPHTLQRRDMVDSWDRAATLLEDIKDFGEAAGRYIPTYKGNPSNTEDISLSQQMDQVKRQYRTKIHHLTINGDARDSQLSRLLEQPANIIDPEKLPALGTALQIDSMALQVALKERHISEIFIYYALMAYQRKTRRSTHLKVRDALTFLSSFISNPRVGRAGRAVLLRLIKCGFLGSPTRITHARSLTPEMMLTMRSQSEYVKKHESAWVSRHNRDPKLRYKRIYHRTDKKSYKYIEEIPTDYGTRLTPLKRVPVDKVRRPYATVFAAKTAKIDSGFIQLLNAGTSAMRAWLYEGVITSWDTPVCRTRIAENLMLSASGQRKYERASQSLYKRHNYLEITEDMLERMDDPARARLTEASKTGGKFKRSRSGRWYRQEGNSFKSDRFDWRCSRRCARLCLSPKWIKIWNATRPAFNVLSIEADGTPIVEHARFLPVNPRLAAGRPMPQTYTSKRVTVKTGDFFAVARGGVAVPSVDPDRWAGFDPLISYDRRNGDLLVPLNPSFSRNIKRFGIRNSRGDLQDLAATNGDLLFGRSAG